MKTLLEILENMYPDVDVANCTEFIDGGIMDSFDIVSLVGEIDDSFGVEIPAEEMIPENFNSAKAIYALIERLLDE